MARKPPSPIRIDGDIAYVSLTRGFEVAIDVADIPLVSPYRWSTLINNETGHAYAVRFDGGKCFLMHREFLRPEPHEKVDHKDGDGLNNRRANIRVCTNTQNIANMAVTRRNKLGLKGVHARGGRFRAQIKRGGCSIELGTYATKEEAAAAYRGAARIIHGDFAHE